MKAIVKIEPNGNETISITITRSHLESIINTQRRYSCLVNDGVNNWDWYLESWGEKDDIYENPSLSMEELVKEIGGEVI